MTFSGSCDLSLFIITLRKLFSFSEDIIRDDELLSTRRGGGE